jgi:prephenate dehydrogenase
MGASIAAAQKRSFPDTMIVGSSISPNDGRIALEKGYIDRFTTNNKEAVRGAERVIVASPPSSIVSILKEIASLVPGIPVTDISSVKGPIYQGFQKDLSSSFPGYTSSHPMAGREESGAQGARANLFDGRTTFLVPFSKKNLRLMESGKTSGLVSVAAAHFWSIRRNMTRYCPSSATCPILFPMPFWSF